MDERSPSEVMRRYWGRVSRGELDGLAEFFAPDAYFEDVATGKVREGRESIAEILTGFFARMPCQFEVETIFDDGRRFSAQWTVSGVHTADILGFPAPTYRPFRYRGVSVGVIEDGLIRRKSDYWDFATVLRQLSPDAP